MKAAALLLGPTGVGLIGLYMNVMQTAASVSALGLSNVGTRQIALAQAESSPVALDKVRRALFWLTLTLAACGGVSFFLLSGWINRVVLQGNHPSDEIAWLSIGVALSVAGGSQTALLTGLRRIQDLAWVTIGTGLLSTAIGIYSIWQWGAQGIVLMVLATPIASFLFGHAFASRLDRPQSARDSLSSLSSDGRKMVRLGAAFMLSGLIAAVGQLVVRSLVSRDLGPEALGQFHAAWTIGMTYLGFVLGAMATDYYPRLSAVISDPITASRLVNEQTEITLSLCAPVVIAMLGLAPWLIEFLYSSEFRPAADILRWQLLGDILKVISWPLSFVILARGDGKTFIFTEALAFTAFVIVTYIWMPSFGVTATGIAFLALYAVYLPLVWWLGGRGIAFRWSKSAILQAIALIIAATTVITLSLYDDFLSAAVAVVLSFAFGVQGVFMISDRMGSQGRLKILTDKIRSMYK